MASSTVNEAPAAYLPLHSSVDSLVSAALDALVAQFPRGRKKIESAAIATQYARLKLAREKDEVFGVFLLTTKNEIIEYREIARGTIDKAYVSPRSILRAIIETNAAAIIMVHNHPSGDVTPSQSDINLTRTVEVAVKFVEARVLDHIIVSAEGSCSLNKEGLI